MSTNQKHDCCVSPLRSILLPHGERRRTLPLEDALLALSILRRADTAAVGDQKCRDPPPLPARYLYHQILLNFLLCFVLREPQPTGEADDVRVAGDAFVLAEAHIENDCGGFVADSRERNEFLHRLRNLPPVLLQKDVAKLLDVLRLRPVEAGAADVALQFLALHPHVILCRSVFPEQLPGNFIDPLVRALGGEDRDDEKIHRRAETKKCFGGIVESLEFSENRIHMHSFGHTEILRFYGAQESPSPPTILVPIPIPHR